MAEIDAVTRTKGLPLTRQSLADELRSYGLTSGQTVLMHMAMSKLNWVVGAAETVIHAMLDVLGPEGTLMMPTQTTSNSDPAEWQHPPVPEAWWQSIRDQTPAFDPAITPTREMGAVPELFRIWPGTIRSSHPMVSFAARGPQAHFLIDNHDLIDELGEKSPLGRLYDLDGYVLLLGVEHWNNTSLHLAENRADYPGKTTIKSGCAMLVNGERQWVEFESMETYGDDFGELGKAFDAAHPVEIGKIQDAEVRLFKQRPCVDFAVKWIEQNRDLTKTSN